MPNKELQSYGLRTVFPVTKCTGPKIWAIFLSGLTQPGQNSALLANKNLKKKTAKNGSLNWLVGKKPKLNLSMTETQPTP